jgi:hypothetical protein
MGTGNYASDVIGTAFAGLLVAAVGGSAGKALQGLKVAGPLAKQIA